MKPSRNLLLRFLGIAFFSAASVLLPLPLLAEKPEDPVNNPAPADLKIEGLDGKPFSLASLKGNVVVLDFWASWCVPCRTSFPFLNALQTKLESKGLRVSGLTLEENTDAIFSFLDSVPANFLIVRDLSGRAGDAFHVVAMPTTFLLDTEGRIAARFEGGDPGTHAKIEAAIAILLSGKPLPPGMDALVSASLEKTGKIKAWPVSYTHLRAHETR